MWRSVRGRLVALAALFALAAAFPAASSSAKKPRFKVVSAKATATLTFRLETTEAESKGTITLVALRKKVGRGNLPGRLLFPLKGTIGERVETRQLIPGTPEYQESNCAKTKKVAGRGGVTLVRIGAEVEVRWAFPQAKPSFCPGPTVDGTVTGVMSQKYPATQFKKKNVTVVMSGANNFKSARLTYSYVWTATLRLRRV